MRALRGLFCAAALVACLAPGVRADEYTKQTFLTFSGPVQLPGITLPAGTYQFKLADPEFGRQTLQVWDKDGNKLFATLLTIPDQRMKPSDEPVVLFGERAAGQAQPIRAWFYPNETYGQEFVYPKDQAMKIAKNTHSSVLAFENDTKDTEYKSAKIGRMDENGRMTDSSAAASAPNDTAKHDAQSASTTTAGGATTTTADDNPAAQSSTAQSDASLNTPARSASAQEQSQPRTNAPMPSANRTDASAPVGTSGSTTTAPEATSTTSEANHDNMPSAVGTTGATNNAASANRTAQAATGANAAAPRANSQAPASPTGTAGRARTLPSTASSMTLVQLLAALSLAGAFAVHLFRIRATRSR